MFTCVLVHIFVREPCRLWQPCLSITFRLPKGESTASLIEGELPGTVVTGWGGCGNRSYLGLGAQKAGKKLRILDHVTPLFVVSSLENRPNGCLDPYTIA